MKTHGNFTYSEIGGFLTAVGTVMHEQEVCAGAALDGYSNERLLESLFEQGFSVDVANELIELPLQFCIDYVMPIHRNDNP